MEDLERDLAHEFDCARCPARPACRDEDCEIAHQETSKCDALEPGAYERALFALEQSRRFPKFDKRPKRWSVEFACVVDAVTRVERSRMRAKAARARAKQRRRGRESDD